MRVQLRRGGELDIALFGQFARQRRQHGLAGLHAAARQMPAVDVGMLDQEDRGPAPSITMARAPSVAGARESPVEVQQLAG